MILQLT